MTVTTALDSRSDQHIDAIVREILAGVPGRAAEIRLLAAADFGAVLDRRGTP